MTLFFRGEVILFTRGNTLRALIGALLFLRSFRAPFFADFTSVCAISTLRPATETLTLRGDLRSITLRGYLTEIGPAAGDCVGRVVSPVGLLSISNS